MALEQKLRLKLSQKLVMTPSLQQAIKLLQLSRLELEEAITQEMVENPMLEVEHGEELDEGSAEREREAADEAAAAEAERPASEEPLPSEDESYGDIDVEAFFSDYLDDRGMSGPSMAARDRGDDVPLENVLSASASLYEHLMWQLHLLQIEDPTVLAAAEFVVGNLDEDGFLQASDEEIARATGANEEQIAEALRVVQTLDPPGIGTRSLRECLLRQVELLRSGEDDPQTATVLDRLHRAIDRSWDDLLHQRWERVAAEVGCDLAELRPLVDVMHRLEPKPGRRHQDERNYYVEPDVYVRRVEGRYEISLNDDGLPKLRMSRQYVKMLEGDSIEPQAASYLRDKMRSALWLMKSIDQRQRTIYKVASSIVEQQEQFLDHGVQHLRPMVLRDVAEDIGMHESTISRVVSNKYMYTPRGMFPMKYFFHSGVDTARGENVSSVAVKERIRRLIEEEDEAKPLSDSKIMKQLQREGVRLARRTVAKYREEMAIPSSDKRRRVF